MFFVGGFHYNLRPVKDALELIDYFFANYPKNSKNIPLTLQDMKVRFCCAKQMRAEWGAWGPW